MSRLPFGLIENYSLPILQSNIGKNNLISSVSCVIRRVVKYPRLRYVISKLA